MGIGAQTLVGLGLLILFSFAAGLLAHSRGGRSLFKALGSTPVGALPQFIAARAITRMLDPEEADIAVVLVPIGPRWAIGFAFGPLDGPWASIYLPGAPRCTSGSVSFVRPCDIHPLDIDVVTAVRLMRGSARARAGAPGPRPPQRRAAQGLGGSVSGESLPGEGRIQPFSRRRWPRPSPGNISQKS